MRKLLLAVLLAATFSTQALAAPGGKHYWEYSEYRDPMTNVVSEHASLDSDTALNFDFPYKGSVASLSLMKKGKSWSTFLHVSKGLFECYICAISVKFDDGPVQKYRASVNSDRKSLMFENGQKFADDIKKAKKVMIQVSFYRDGVRYLEFATDGLRRW